MITEAQRSDLYAAQIGQRNRDYYLERFARFDERGGFVPSWNWAAFLFAAAWALYRKMYGVFFVTAGLVVLWEVLAVVLPMLASLSLPVYAAVWAFFGVFGNALYHRHASKKIERARAENSDVDKATLQVRFRGGVHVWVLPAFILGPFAIGVSAGILLPAYQDYTIRAQVSLGLDLAADVRRAVESRYEATGIPPGDNASASLPAATSITGDYVSSVEVRRGEIVITYGNKAHSAIRGNTVVLTFAPRPDGTREWECGSRTIRPKHLPAACRMPR